MGLGKTAQTLAFLRRAHQGDGPALVVCPTSLVTNWENEARKFTPELKTLVLEGADRAARFNSIRKVDMVITSYALLRRDIDTLREFNFSTAVLDEAQHIKNPETQTAAGRLRSSRSPIGFVLTGTPMENSVRDLWSLMNFVAPGYLGSRNDFRERYELPIARGSAAPSRKPRLTFAGSSRAFARGQNTTRERSARENSSRSCLYRQRAISTRPATICGAARDPARSSAAPQECEHRCPTDEDAHWPAPLRQVCGTCGL